MRLMKLEQAPKSGTIYALFRDNILYEPYPSRKFSPEETDQLLELHIFDDTSEYRYIKCRSRDDIEMLVTDNTSDYDDVYEEEIFVSGKKGIKVINYIKFDENDLLHIVNYRLQEVK